MRRIILLIFLTINIGICDSENYANNPKELMNIAYKLSSQASQYKDFAVSSKQKLISNNQSSITQDQALAYKSNLEKKAKVYKEYAETSQETLDQKAQKYKGYAQHIQKVSTDKLLKPIRMSNQPGHMLIFVSLGMPTESLAEITLAAYKYNIPVIIRGLYKNTYKSTVERIQDILMRNSRTHPVGGFLIDPNWFTVYKVNRVPAYVLTNQLASCPSQDLSHCEIPNYDILYGNITVKSALEEFKHRGDFSDLAYRVLRKGNLNA
jgi:type-F conjugative transfer system pilin assembly protein TrbC